MFRFRDELSRALGGSVGPIPEDVLERLETLDRLLVHWSARVDLVGFKSDEERVERYFAEPLAATPWLPERVGSALDIGSGGGTPALPLAVFRRGSRWKLLEPRRKKSLFLEEAVRALDLDNVEVSNERFRGRLSPGAWDLVTTRGVRLSEEELEDVLGGLGEGGRFLWFSGETRLEQAGRLLRGRPDREVRGPVRLLSASSRSSLLVVERS